jgi:hypothetical protein
MLLTRSAAKSGILDQHATQQHALPSTETQNNQRTTKRASAMRSGYAYESRSNKSEFSQSKWVWC